MAGIGGQPTALTPSQIVELRQDRHEGLLTYRDLAAKWHIGAATAHRLVTGGQPERRLVWRVCGQCGERFQTRRPRTNGKVTSYCSTSCYWAARWLRRTLEKRER